MNFSVWKTCNMALKVSRWLCSQSSQVISTQSHTHTFKAFPFSWTETKDTSCPSKTRGGEEPGAQNRAIRSELNKYENW